MSKEKNRITIEDKKRIVNCYKLGMSVTDIAQDFKCGKSTAYAIISDYKAHGDFIFAENSENKEPATAATVTSPKDTETTDIVPQVEENVKPCVPKSVLAAVKARQTAVRTKYDSVMHQFELLAERKKSLETELEELAEFCSMNGVNENDTL